MQFAYQLLIAAMTLLTTVSTNPNVSADLKAQATLVANQAIVYAQDVIQEDTIAVNTPVVNAPVGQNTVQNSVQSNPVSTQVSIPMSLEVAFNDPYNINYSTTTIVYGGNCLTYNFYATVKDQNGQTMDNQPISLINPDTGEAILANSLGGVAKPLFPYKAPVLFHYTPQKNSGSVDLTFTSGNISTTTSIGLKSIMQYDVEPDGSFADNPEQKGIYVYRKTLALWMDTTTGMCVKDSVVNSQ